MDDEVMQRVLLAQRCRDALERCLGRVTAGELEILLSGTDDEALRLLAFREGFFDPVVRQRFRDLMGAG